MTSSERLRAPLVLAFDTSGEEGVVVVGRGTEVLAHRIIDGASRQGAELVPRIAEVLAAAQVSLRDVAEIVVGAGPGSFTGIRIAAATARGLARPLGLTVWPVSSLAAGGAVNPFAAHAPRLVLFDARGDRLYGGGWSRRDGVLSTWLEPRALTVQDVLEMTLPDGCELCGTGAVRHAAVWREAGRTVLPLPVGVPSAEGLLRVRAELSGAAPAGKDWEPAYLRPSQPEREAAVQGSLGGA